MRRQGSRTAEQDLFKRFASSAKADAQDGTTYAYKASLVGSAHRFELTEQGLSFHVGRKSGVWPYGDIASVRLSYRPVSMQSRRFRADIGNASGERIAILSTTWQTVALMAPQDREYRAFIVELHKRLASVEGRIVLAGGLRPWIYNASLGIIGILAVAMVGLLARAVAVGEFGGILFIAAFAALFGWQIGGFVLRNKPRNYTFDELPKELLP
jgi:hypothetical protein